MTAPKRPSPAKSGPKPTGKAKPTKSAAATKPAKPQGKGNPTANKVKPTATKPAGKAKPAAARPAGKAKPEAKPTKAAKPVPVAAKPVPEKIPPRGQLVPKLHKALKSHYKPVATDTSRDLLQQLLLACCLENAPADAAEKAFGRLLEAYIDLNEVRVTTVAELAETLHDLPDPSRAALSLRRALQAIFESTYTFSLDHARKHSLAHGLKVLEGLHGVPPFAVSYVASTSLGGHLIPLDKGALGGLWLCGIITQQEYDSGKVPGLERAIGKKSGVEFSSLLHQFGLDVLTNLHGMTVRKIVQGVNPEAAKERFPKRGEQMPEPVPPVATDRAAIKAADAAQAAADELRPAGPQAAARPAGKTPMPPPGSGPKKTADGKVKSGPKPFVVKPLSLKPPAPPPPEPTPATKASAKPAATSTAKHSSQLSKRKPR
jgi:endonuclease III